MLLTEMLWSYTEAVAPVGRPDFQAQALAKFAAGLIADPYGEPD
jgi:hypothetical protein